MVAAWTIWSFSGASALGLLRFLSIPGCARLSYKVWSDDLGQWWPEVPQGPRQFAGGEAFPPGPGGLRAGRRGPCPDRPIRPAAFGEIWRAAKIGRKPWSARVFVAVVQSRQQVFRFREATFSGKKFCRPKPPEIGQTLRPQGLTALLAAHAIRAYCHVGEASCKVSMGSSKEAAGCRLMRLHG